ncbi:MAG: hypothetical protein U1E39_11750 [Planctomycetota bacterium]
MRRPLLVAAVLGAALFAPALRARADSVLLADGRTVDCPKAEKLPDGGVKLHLQNGEIVLKAGLVKEVFATAADGAYLPKDDAEKAKLEKGLVPYDGKWVPKAERDAAVARRANEARKRIEEAKAHREWRNRYREKTANFEFEYTLPPDLAKGYMDLMEGYFAYFTRAWNVPKPKERLKVCLYHDYETFLEVSGAPRGVIGYYQPNPPRELNFYYDRMQPHETQAVMFHETQHYLAHLFDLRFDIPHWIGEAMAEYYGASTWDAAAKKMTTGGLQEGRLTEVQSDIARGERRPLAKLLDNTLGYHDYTWGWTFVHFMMETPKYAKKFQTFYRTLASAKDLRRDVRGDYVTVRGDELSRGFQKALGVADLPALEKEWYAYIDTKLKLESVVGYEAAGFSAGYQRPLRAKRFFKLAVEKGSKNPAVYLRYGNLIAGEESSTALDLYRKGLELDPLNPELWLALGQHTRGLGGDENTAAGTKMMALAAELDPESAETWLLVQEALEKTAPTPAPSGPPSGPGDGDD